jgi:hypothetical protein
MNQNEQLQALSTPIGVLSFMPETKAQVQTFAEMIRLEVINGNINPLEVMARVKAVEATIKAVLDMPEIKDEARAEAEKYGEKSFDFKNFRVEQAEVGVSYDYSGCGCPIYNRLEAEFKTAKKLLSDRETELKALKNPQTVVDDITGEVATINPPLKRSTSGLKFTLK